MNELTLTTERLWLRPTAVYDAEFIYALMNTPKWLQYIGDRNIKTLKDAEKYILDNIIPQRERLGYSTYAVIKKADNSKMGTCGLYDREGLEGIDIGFAFLPEYERRGYALEATRALIETSAKKFKLDALSGITAKDNVASQNLLKKLGFAFSKTIRLKETELLLFNIV